MKEINPKSLMLAHFLMSYEKLIHIEELEIPVEWVALAEEFNAILSQKTPESEELVGEIFNAIITIADASFNEYQNLLKEESDE